MSDSYADWRDRLAAGLNQRLYPTAYLDELLVSGSAFLLVTASAAIVIELKRFPSGLIAVHGLVAAGDKAEIKQVLIPAAEQFGRENGAEIGLIESREGWARELKEDGYEVFQTSIGKEL